MISVTASANAVSWFAMAFWTSEGMVGNPSVEPDQDCEVALPQVSGNRTSTATRTSPVLKVGISQGRAFTVNLPRSTQHAADSVFRPYPIISKR